MKKESNLKTVFAVNIVILTLIALNKTYKPVLEKLSEQYIKLKRENKDKLNRKSINYKEMTTKILKEAKTKVGPLENLLNETLINHNIQDATKTMSKEVQVYLDKKFNALKDGLVQYVMAYQVPRQTITSFKTGSNVIITDIGSTKEIIDSTYAEITSLVLSCREVAPTLKQSFTGTEEIKNVPNFSNMINQFIVKHCCFPVALMVALNSFGLSNKANEYDSLDYEITTDLENYFTDPEVITELEESLLDFMENISPLTDSLTDIAHTPVTIDQKINGILASEETTYQEKFNAILDLTEITFEERLDRIIHSGITTYDEIFEFLTQKSEFTIDQKIWYALLIPNQSFETVFLKLLTIEGITEEQVIQSIINADLVSFETLFDSILKIEGLTKERLTKYLCLYQADYNSITLKEKVQYVFQIDMLSQKEKVDCIWDLMSEYSLPDKILFILDLYNITYQDYINLYSMNTKDLTEEYRMILHFFEKVNLEKITYILENYPFASKEQLDIVIACCAAEGANSYADLYCVANTVYNRVTNPYYIQKWGENPYNQVIAPSQFTVYGKNKYLPYLNATDPLYERKCKLALVAFCDMFYYGYDVHDYVQFRGWNKKTFSNNYVIEGGNRYDTLMDDSIRTITRSSDEQDKVPQLIKEIKFH